MSGLHIIQSLLDDPAIKLKETKDVRWLSYDAAVATLLRTLPSLIVSLDREASKRGEPTAEGLLRFVKTHSFIVTVHLLHKVLPMLVGSLVSFKRKMSSSPCLGLVWMQLLLQ